MHTENTTNEEPTTEDSTEEELGDLVIIIKDKNTGEPIPGAKVEIKKDGEV